MRWLDAVVGFYVRGKGHPVFFDGIFWKLGDMSWNNCPVFRRTVDSKCKEDILMFYAARSNEWIITTAMNVFLPSSSCARRRRISGPAKVFAISRGGEPTPKDVQAWLVFSYTGKPLRRSTLDVTALHELEEGDGRLHEVRVHCSKLLIN